MSFTPSRNLSLLAVAASLAFASAGCATKSKAVASSARGSAAKARFVGAPPPAVKKAKSEIENELTQVGAKEDGALSPELVREILEVTPPPAQAPVIASEPAKDEPQEYPPHALDEMDSNARGGERLRAIPVARLNQAGAPVAPEPLKRLDALEASSFELSASEETPLIFDIPVTYNDRVRAWIRYFQTEGRTSFRIWLERSARYLPFLQYELQRAGLPQDLVYVAMIESGFNSNAASHAGAMGMWQFIEATGERYNLKVDWWIDERKDFHKATRAAIRYMSDLFKQFESWYLVTASYNMGENGVRRLIARHKTHNFWELANRGALPAETTDYVPKILAAVLISKAPGLYGFRDLNYQMPLSYESVVVPGGTDIINLAGYLGVSEKYLKELNPELIKGFIPRNIRGHKIRVPKGSSLAVSQFIRQVVKNDPHATAAN